MGGNPLSNVDPLGSKTCPLKPGQIPRTDEALENSYPDLAVLGIGRLLYAGAAAAIPSVAAATTETGLGEAAAAVGARNALKTTFRLGFFPNFRMHSVNQVLARYGGDAAEAAAAAGRTNAALNSAAAAAAATATVGSDQIASNSNCECP